MVNEKAITGSRITQKHGLSRQDVLRVVGAGTGVVVVPGLLAACCSETQPSSTPIVKSAEGKLTFWHWGESHCAGRERLHRRKPQGYKKEKPDLGINVVPQATDTLINTFQAAVLARQAPT